MKSREFIPCTALTFKAHHAAHHFQDGHFLVHCPGYASPVFLQAQIRELEEEIKSLRSKQEDLIFRAKRAANELVLMAEEVTPLQRTYSAEGSRLKAKAEGVRLVLSYIEEMERVG